MKTRLAEAGFSVLKKLKYLVNHKQSDNIYYPDSCNSSSNQHFKSIK